MSIRPINSDGKTDSLQYQQRAAITCEVSLVYPLNNAQEFKGLLIKVSKENGETYEDGCKTGSSLNTFLRDASIKCPSYSPTANVYAVSMETIVTNRLVGDNYYQCTFMHRNGQAIRSAIKRMVGARIPDVRINPVSIDGYSGVKYPIACYSQYGYPLQVTDLRLGKLGLREQGARYNGEMEIIRGSLTLYREYQGMQIRCNNARFPSANVMSDPINVRYLDKKDGSSATVNAILGDVTLSCADQFNTNAKIEYEWEPTIIPQGMRYQDRVIIYYDERWAGRQRIAICSAKMAGDPLNRIQKIKFFLNYENVEIREVAQQNAAQGSAGRTKAPNYPLPSKYSAVTGVITVLVIGTVGLMAVMVAMEVKKSQSNNHILPTGIER